MLTQDQWYQKLKSWVPKWFFEKEFYQAAFWQALAKTFSEIDKIAADHQAETFITEADGVFIDAQGDERSIPRLPNEMDTSYAPRVQLIVNRSDKPDLQTLIDALLAVKPAIIIEHGYTLACASRGTFANRREIFTDRRYNRYFTVLVQKQYVQSNSFASRDCYANRLNEAGAWPVIPASLILEVVRAVVDREKAGGVLYRLIEE